MSHYVNCAECHIEWHARNATLSGSNCAANVTVQLVAVQFVIVASLAVLRYLALPVDVTFPDFQIRSVIS